MLRTLYGLIRLFILFSAIEAQTLIRWCTISVPEESKCNRLSLIISGLTEFASLYTLQCVLGRDEFDCMKRISNNSADLIDLDAGLAHYASSLYSLRPIAVENYVPSNAENQRVLYYYANVVVPKNSTVDPTNLRGKELCLAGAGTAEGWVMPVGKLIDDLRTIPVTQCNSVVQNLIRYLGDCCIPNALSEVFNPFGDNTQEVCQLCYDKGLQQFCTSRDRYAGNQGALLCLNDHIQNIETQVKPVAAFVRAQEIDLAQTDGFPAMNYELLCPTKQANGQWRAGLTEFAVCQWGQIPARMIMTALTRQNIDVYKNFITTLLQYFGPTVPIPPQNFQLFDSKGYGTQGSTDQTHHLMFSDFTKNIYIPPEQNTATYYRWIDPQFMTALKKLDKCPLPTLAWCVIDEWEMSKCQKMSTAFSAKSIQPDLACIQAENVVDCMRLIRDGYADMVNLEAGDLYTAGKHFDLVPIVAENYGAGPFFYAVGVVKKVNPGLLISNWRHRRTCHSGVGKATGWIVPLNTVLDTRQVRVLDGHMIYAYGELVSRSCIPGVLNTPYNPSNSNALNLCELCTGGNKDRCRRDNLELYYGDAGAFRCLVESGDVAFARQTTVHANTASRNPNYWARDVRQDDFQLLCPDGRRAEIDEWQSCNLGRIPSNVIVTASYKSENERTNMWRLLQYGQEYYSSDHDPIFRMFESGFGKSDLMFTDETESLSLIKWEDQTYVKWLGPLFIQQIENLEATAQLGESGVYNAAIQRAPAVWFTFCIFIFVLYIPHF